MWHRPAPRVLALAAVLVAVAVVLLVSVGDAAPPLAFPGRPWAILVVTGLFVAADKYIVHIEVRGNAHSYTMAEVPLTLGLFLLTPWQIAAATLVGAAIGLPAVRRQGPLKATFNLSLFVLGSAVATWLFHLFTGPATSPRDLWLIALGATLAASAITSLSVAGVLQLTGTPSVPRLLPQMFAGNLLQCFLSTATTLLALLVWQADPVAVALVLLLGAIPLLTNHAHTLLSQRYRRLQRLYDFTRQLSHAPRSEDAVRATLEQALDLLRARVTELHLPDPHGGAAVVVRMADGALTTTTAPASPWDAVTSADEVLVARATRDPVELMLLDTFDCRELVAVPLLSADARIGTLVARDRLGDTGTFTDQDLGILGTLATHVSAALTSARLLDELRSEAADKEHQSLHDALTGLGNRTLFALRAGEVLSSGRSAAVLLLDLNHFKDVNDTLGHAQGDRLLQEVSRRLRAATPDRSTLARLGGDEFVLLIPDPRSAAEVLDVARRLIATLERPMQLDQLTVGLGAAVGVAMAPDHGHTADALLQRADIAMYIAKEARISAVQLYDRAVDARSDRRLALAADLRLALDAGGIDVFYQPQCSLSDGRVRGFEALARWRHPEHGFISPEEFVPLAESVGLIHRLTERVLRTALEQSKAWAGQGVDMSVAVNLSAQSLMDVSLPDEVGSLLGELGVPARRLTLEVTEGHIMRDPDRAVEVLERLAGAGVRLSIDDFGTGYSSLAYLRDLPVHEVKIDKSFVMGMTRARSDATIVRSVVDLARNLNLESVAEGVEDVETWQLLRGIGCRTAQGYLLSRPVPAPEATRWLAERRAGIARPPQHSAPAQVA